MSQKINKRVPVSLHNGQHQSIVSDTLFLQNQERLKARRTHPGNSKQKRRVYPLKGVGKCWECWECLGEIVGLRGSTGGRNRYAFYRCAARHDRGMSRKPTAKSTAQAAVERVELKAHRHDDLQNWLARHHNLKENHLMPQVDALLARFAMPYEWQRRVMAYLHHPDGILHFEAEVRGIQKQQGYLKRLYQAGEIDLAKLQLEGAILQARIDAFWGTTFDPAKLIEADLSNFQHLWERLQPFEKNNLLNLIFEGLFFDGAGRLRWILVHSPFDRLLGLPEGGLMVDG